MILGKLELYATVQAANYSSFFLWFYISMVLAGLNTDLCSRRHSVHEVTEHVPSQSPKEPSLPKNILTEIEA